MLTSLQNYNFSFAEIIVAEVGAVIQIQVQGIYESLNINICIATEGLVADCYRPNDERLQENYNLTDCHNNSRQLCLQTTAKLETNNTLYTVLRSREYCNISSSLWVGVTSKLIIRGK